MNNKKWLLLTLVLNGFFIGASGNNNNHLLYEHLRSSVEQLDDLYNYQGKTLSCNNFPNKSSLLRIIQQDILLENPQRAFLFYYHAEDTIHIHLINATQHLYSKSFLTEHYLYELEGTYRVSLGIEKLVSSRAPQKRGVETIYISKPRKSLLKKNQEELKSVLYPTAIMHGLRGVKNILIQPSKNIGLIPFYATKPFSNSEAYFVDSFSYSIVPHICNLFSLGTNDNLSEKWGGKVSLKIDNPLIIGNPLYFQEDYFFPPLVGAEAEALGLYQKIGGTILTGKNATLTNVRNFAKSADLLYFATHGIGSIDFPLDSSFLAFTPDSLSPNGYWTAREIQYFKFNAELAILSACQTGYGFSMPGGYVGLGRAFYKAGVKNTVTSLWSVDDQATAELMELFMEELQKPSLFFPSEPLRNAVLQFKKENKDPAKWAPFMVFGFGY